MTKPKKRDRHTVTFDFETDPFKFGRVPKPFCVGVYDGAEYNDLWADDPGTLAQFIFDIAEVWEDDAIFYAHNMGKFDFHFLLPYAEHISEVVMIGSRVVQARLNGTLFRDSYALIPVSLATHQKTEIEYWKMEREHREQHKPEILSYLKDDCVNLHVLVSAFIDEFGTHLTMASAALKQLAGFHPYDKMSGDKQDAQFRQFYYGGRVEYFEQGTLRGPLKIYDVNSMYPSVMRDYQHPITDQFNVISGRAAYNDKIIAKCAFAEVECFSEGAFPFRAVDEQNKLYFPHAKRVYFVTGHELRMALKLNAVRGLTIRFVYIAEKTTSFAQFVDHFYNARMKAKAEKNKLYDLFYKLILNSAYGKFAQNPEDFREFLFTRGDIPPTEEKWTMVWHDPESLCRIYERPSRQPLYVGRHNVSTAASITGAARATLFEGLRNATRPVYCDTDSIICEGLANVPLDPVKLGAWDLEKTGDRLSVVGRKTYALYNGNECVKVASKGVRATGDEISRIAEGEVLEFENMAPTFSVKRPTKFVKRKVRLT